MPLRRTFRVIDNQGRTISRHSTQSEAFHAMDLLQLEEVRVGGTRTFTVK